MEIHGFETLLIVQRISPKQGARCKVGYESHRWDGLSDPGIRLCRLPTLVPFSSTNLHPGTGLPPLARKSGLGEQGLGLRSSLEPEPEPEPGQGQGQWLTSLSSREMANPRAGSKPKPTVWLSR